MKFFYATGTCSMGIHLLLEEIGQPYDRHRLKFATDDQKSSTYLAINPKGKVPALHTDTDGVITEFPAIAFYLAKRYREARLLPDDMMAEVRALEIIDYAVANIHMRGFSRLASPTNFSADGDPDLVRRVAFDIIDAGMRILAGYLKKQAYFLGDFSIADAAVFNLEWWANRRNITLPPTIQAHYERMMVRPSIQRMLAAEQ